MELNVAQCELKMKQLLEKFLAPSYPAKLDSYLDKLLVHLAYLDEAGVNSTLVSTHPIFTEWITRTVPKWNTEGTIPPTKIVAITLYLLTLLSKNEERFTLLNDNNVYFDLVNILKAKQIDVAPSVKLTYIKLISSFFKHRSGIELIIISNFWEDIFTMSLTPQPLPAIFIESHKFMAKLLECTIDYNEFFCNEIVSQIMLLLGENISIAIEACDDDSVNCQIQNRNLSNSLQLVGNILEYFLEGTLFGIRDFRIPLIFLQHFNFEKRIFDFMLIAQDKHFIFDMGKIVFLMQFLELYMKVTNNIIDPENLQISINKIMHNFTEHIAKGNFENVMKFCDFGQFYWNLMGYKIPHFGSEDGNESINLAKELVALGSLPNFLLIRKYCYSTISELENVLEDDFRNFFMGRLMGMMSEKVLRLAYIWRDFLLDQPNLFEICFLCLVSFKKSRKYFPKDRAVVIFQLLLYNLQDFLAVMEESPEKFDIFTREIGYFSNLFEVLAICIEEFHVKWTDSVEVIDVMAVTTDFLMVPTWPNQVVVKALKLVDISINKYMSPNLALLVDSVNDSTMLRLGPLLQIKLYSEAPEVKNACLEVIYTISRMTNNKVNTVITLPIFAEWITRAVTIWNSKGIMPSPMIVSFTLNLASLLSKNEERFNELNINNFYIKLINILKSREPYVAPPSKLAYIKLLLSLLEHKSGIEWMMACNFWEDIFQSCLTGQTNSIMAESQNFMTKFLDVTIDHDRNFCNKVVKQIMMPLGENIYMSIKSFGDVVNDEVLSQNLSVTLRLIGDILEYFLDRTLYDRNDFRIPLIFLKNFHLEQRISDFMLVAQNKHLAFDLGKIMFIMQFLELYVDVTKDPINIVMDTKSSVDRIINIFFMNMSKGNFDNVLRYCEFGHLYWNLMGSKIPHFQISDVNESIKIANRLIMFNCLPNFCLVLRYCRSLQEIEQLLEDPFRSIFSNKLHKIYLCVRTTRLIYIWRDRVQDLPNLFEIACTTLKNIKKSWKYFPREQATLIFQLFAYNLKDYLYGMEKNPELIYTFTKEVEYFALIFEVIAILIEQFHINWTDTVEACDVMSSAFDFLTNPGWSTKVTVNALKLVNVALDKYMSPNLTLLVDRVSDSTMAFLGPLLRNKLLYENWDVKNSAIEVVFTISRMSNNKFTLINRPIFIEWITRAVAAWNTKGITPPTNIVCFTLNLASSLSESEERFSRLNVNNFYIKLVNVSKARGSKAPPSVKLAYIKLVSSFLDHKSGIEWMIACNFWEDIFQLCLTAETILITTESHKFMKKILQRTIDQDETFSNNIIKRIMLPLNNNISRIIKESNNELSQNLATTLLTLVGNLLQWLLEDQNDFRVPLLLWKNFHLEEKISDFILIVQNRHLPFILGKIVFIMQFLELYDSLSKDPENIIDAKASVSQIMNIFVTNLYNGTYEELLEYCNFGQFYWHLMGTKIPHFEVADSNQSITFADDVIIMHTFPNFCLTIKYCYPMEKIDDRLNDDFRNIAMQRLLKLMSQSTLRLGFHWRDSLITHPNLFTIAFQGLCCIKNSWKYYPKDRVISIFQTLVYCLIDFFNAMRECSKTFEIFTKQTEYFAMAFEIFAILIEEFHITWKDSVEIVDIMSITFDFLTISWPSKVVVKLLKLIDISINKYISPNLTLLVDTTDSIMGSLGPLLYSKLHDDAWDVKNTALEVICTMSRISRKKFPSLQKVLMDSELPTLVVKMSTCDGESFVRATAIKCLQEMIQVEEIWNNILKAEDLPLKMRDILLNETEGIVRVEAATFMCIAYENQQFQPETLDTIYETMIYSSTTDLHWEVKVRALGFWDKVIKNHLQNQGMIDGSFPNVTFSKEHRKIVTLTDAEIRKRLQKVLNQLSSIGCLGVLVSAIKDDCDMEVSKTAVKITQSLVDLFKKYNVYGDLGAPTSPLPVENGVSSSVSMSSGISVDESMDSPNNFFNSDFTDEIINEIVNSKDVSLLKNVYSPSDYGSVVNYDFQVRKIISPNEFLQFTQQDLNNVIAEKKNWLNGIEDLGSLLDDMLKTYDDDVNNMDCY